MGRDRNKKVEKEMKIALGLALAAQASAAECPEGWPRIWNKETTEYYDLCWKHIGSGTFNDAVTKCAELGAGLPMPKSERENIDFSAQYNHIPTNWLGMTWQPESQTWTDMKGNELSYMPWAANNPQYLPSAENNFFNAAHQVSSLDKLQWKNLPHVAGSEIICVMELKDPEPTDEPSKEKTPDYRPGKIRDDILEVLDNSQLADTKLYELVNKRVSSNKGKMITQYFGLAKEKECTFPDHWNWEEYKNSEFNPDRYNREDPCKAINQLFLGLDRWMQIFTRDCTKSKENALKFHGRRNKQLTRVRNRIFLRMECSQFIKKYDL